MFKVSFCLCLIECWILGLSLSCGDAGADGSASLIDLKEEPAGANCSNGGTLVRTGIDQNNDNQLQDGEVTQSAFVCNGQAGADGAQALVKLDSEPEGLHCPSGGVVIRTGLDQNHNNLLDPEEVSQTSYVCNPVDYPLELTELKAFACPGVFNGHFMAAGNQGKVFIVEFPGGNSAPGILHVAGRDGTVQLNANTALPDGCSNIVRSPSGRIYTLGTQSSPSFEQQIFEINADNGSTVGPVFQQPATFYAYGLCVDENENLYLGNSDTSSPTIYKIAGTALNEFSTGFGNNNRMDFSLDESKIFVSSGLWFGYTTPGGTAQELKSYSGMDCFIVSQARDSLGRIYVGVDCSMAIPATGSFVDRYGPDGENPTTIITSTQGIRGPIYDPINHEIVVLGIGPTEKIEGCGAASGTLYSLKVD